MWLVKNKSLGGRDEIGPRFIAHVWSIANTITRKVAAKSFRTRKKSATDFPATLLCFVLELLSLCAIEVILRSVRNFSKFVDRARFRRSEAAGRVRALNVHSNEGVAELRHVLAAFLSTRAFSGIFWRVSF
jgi:hypothetical protein